MAKEVGHDGAVSRATGAVDENNLPILLLEGQIIEHHRSKFYAPAKVVLSSALKFRVAVLQDM